MKRLTLFSFVLVGAVLLSACSASATRNSWPGLAADANNAYLANGSSVYAVRLKDGSQVWKYPEKNGSQLYYSNPVLTPDGQLLIGSSGSDNGLTSLDSATGKEKWAAPFVGEDRWVASPLVVGDAVYAPNNDGTLFALSLATGEKQWSVSLGPPLWSAPVTDGNLIFVTSLDHFLYAVDPSTHKVAWKIDLAGSAPSSPSVSADGKTLFVGSFADKVFAIDIASHSVRWTANTKDWVWAAPVPAGDSVFVADLSGYIYSLGAPNGKNAWPTIQPDGPITGNPLVLSDGSVLYATESGSVFAYDGNSTKLWDVNVGGNIYTTPALSGDLALIAPMNADFQLAAVRKDGTLLWKFKGK